MFFAPAPGTDAQRAALREIIQRWNPSRLHDEHAIWREIDALLTPSGSGEARVKCEAEDACNSIIADRDRVLDALLCPLHGRCVPHALDEIARLKAAAPATSAGGTTALVEALANVVYWYDNAHNDGRFLAYAMGTVRAALATARAPEGP